MYKASHISTRRNEFKMKSSIANIMLIVAAALCLSAVHAAEDVKITEDNIAELAGGRSVFLKFFAPWCGHCKRMAPAWSELMEKHADSKALFVAKVDCTAEGKSLCTKVGVRGFPTIMHGRVGDLEKYSGGRGVESLTKFAESITPLCTLSNRGACNEEENVLLDELLKLDASSVQKEIDAANERIKTAEAAHELQLKQIQDALEKERQAYLDRVNEIKDVRYKMLLAVSTGSPTDSKTQSEDL